jgi:hypothetical protein
MFFLEGRFWIYQSRNFQKRFLFKFPGSRNLFESNGHFARCGAEPHCISTRSSSGRNRNYIHHSGVSSNKKAGWKRLTNEKQSVLLVRKRLFPS